jgi:hypothetical protein
MIGAAMRGGLMLMRDQGRDVFGDFDLLAAVITARVRRDHASGHRGCAPDPGLATTVSVRATQVCGIE